MLRRAVSALLLAAGFLTIIPIRDTGSHDFSTIGRSLGWFPVVGLLIGCLLASVDQIAGSVFSSGVTVALVITAAVAISGAFHFDGLADTADGVFGGRTPERRLEIMRDSRVGSFGVVAVGLVLLLLYSGLSAIPDTDRWRPLLVVPSLSRAGMVYTIAAYPYARPTGLGRTFKDEVSYIDVVVAAACALVVAVAIMQVEGLVLWVVGLVAAVAIGWTISRRLGGLTGDVYGAVAVLSEVVLFLVVAAERPR